MDINKDYYQTLGITPSAELAVIKAVYKALANKYHPDKHTGNKAQADAKMREINEAYEVLSDSAKRASYDASRNKADEAEFEETDESVKQAEDTLAQIIQSDWTTAEKYHASLRKCVQELEAISRTLVLPFKIYVLEEKQFAKADEIVSAMIKDYLEGYFGKDIRVLKFAKQLLVDGDIAAARELNKVVRVLGSTIDPLSVIDRISAEYKTRAWLREQEHRTRAWNREKASGEEAMKLLGISYDGERYEYKGYRYENLQDAIAYAKLHEQKSANANS